MLTYLDRAREVWKTESEAIAQIDRMVEKEAFNRVVDLFAESKGRIFIAGCGTSAMAAKKVAHTLTCVEKPASYLNPSDAVHGGLGLLQTADILILISKGGNTSELAPLITACQEKGAHLIGVTENADSTIGKSANDLLKIKIESEPDRYNMLATASTITVIALFDAISIQVMELTGFTQKQFGIIHPGGAVGERLRKTE